MAKTVDDPVSGAMVYRRLRAPRRHGEALIEPSFRDAAEQMQRNRARLFEQTSDLHGRSLAQLAESGRQELLEAARSYTFSYRDAFEVDVQANLLLTGHQPELYHPGVWFKNFAIDAIARRNAATPINLIIDNDLPRSTSITCPQIVGTQARVTSIPFDRPGHYVPYEERGILDESLFRSFAGRTAVAIEPLIANPIVSDFWPAAIDAAHRTQRIGLAVAQARHQLEKRLGLQTLEVPWSKVCDSRTFQWFAAHLLAELPRLHQHYNEALHEYRRIHRLRSRTHPVADLEEADEWLEAPFWIWAESDPHRRRLFVRRNHGCIELSDRRRLRACLPLEENLDTMLDAWQSNRIHGIKIRPRALITTMYARLVLGDSFIHGIGGAKYDQLTDEIIRRLFQMDAPSYMTVTATVLLPIAREDVEKMDVQRVANALRELDFHPERHAPADVIVERLAEEKWSWIGADVPAARFRERHEAISRVNELLQPWVRPVREKLLCEREELMTKLGRARVTNSREYSFCLFPEKRLHDILLDILEKHL